MVSLASLLWLMMTGAPSQPILVQSEHFSYEISADGTNLAFRQRESGKDFLDTSSGTSFAVLIKDGKTYPATNIELRSDSLIVDFAELNAQVILEILTNPHFVRLRVNSLTGDGVDSISFLNTPLLTDRKPSADSFVAGVLALNLQTNVDEIPGPQQKLEARAYGRFGVVGAEFALVGCKYAEMREILKQVVRSARELPQYDEPIGGPWAMDASINRGSYLFDFGNVTEETVNKWIALAKDFGLNQIDFHTGKSFRFGDYTPNPELFPKGYESVKAVIDKLHDAGIAAGLHTYPFFIAKDSPHVTPVPDPGLGKDAVFTLARGLSVEDSEVRVVESTESLSTVTGFFVRNSVTLQIDDELIVYEGIEKAPPFGFTKCERGAYGTKPAPHAEGAKVYHLKECFGLFTPDPDAELFTRVAEHTADTFNRCGFDMIYLDALDGEDILAGHDFAWHYGSAFTFEIAKRLNKPALFEMSTFHHHLWYVRARMGAWDCPSRGYRQFIDIHAQENQKAHTYFMPTNLGWWAVQKWSDDLARNTFVEPTYPEDIEYLLAKCLAFDSGFALIGINPDVVSSVPAYARLAPLFQTYETLRHSGYFSEPIRKQVAEPGTDYTLVQDSPDVWHFVPARYVKHKVTGLEDDSNRWVIDNAFDDQPLRFRIQALLSCEPYDSAKSLVLEDFSDVTRYAPRDPSAAVLMEKTEDGVRLSNTTATNGQGSPWVQVERRFEPPIVLNNRAALGCWVKGDGRVRY